MEKTIAKRYKSCDSVTLENDKTRETEHLSSCRVVEFQWGFEWSGCEFYGRAARAFLCREGTILCLDGCHGYVNLYVG